MNKIGGFGKVSYEQFAADIKDVFPDFSEDNLREIYDGIKLPKRATAGSASNDFFVPMDITLEPGQSIKVPTGIRVRMNPGWWLSCFPRSGLGFKYRIQLDNTVGVIDSDYYNAKNEGHIMLKITNDSREGKTLQLKSGDAFAQGIFLIYGITYDDDVESARTGGFGSTGM